VKSKKAPSKDNTSGYVSSKSRNGGDRRGDRFRKQDGRVDNRSGKARGGKNINMEPRDAANRSNMDASSAISKGKNAPVQKENDTAQAQQKHTQSNAATDGSNGARAGGKPAAGGGKDKDKEKARAKEMDNVKAKEPINANANTVSWAKLVTTGPKEVVPPKADNAESQSTTTTAAAAASSSSPSSSSNSNSNSKKDATGNAHKSSKGESKAAVTRVETANKTVSESNAEREKAKEKETEKGKEKAGRNERKSASKPVITATDDTATGMVDTGPNSLTQGETGRPTRNRGGRKEKESEKEKKKEKDSMDKEGHGGEGKVTSRGKGLVSLPTGLPSDMAASMSLQFGSLRIGEPASTAATHSKSRSEKSATSTTAAAANAAASTQKPAQRTKAAAPHNGISVSAAQRDPAVASVQSAAPSVNRKGSETSSAQSSESSISTAATTTAAAVSTQGPSSRAAPVKQTLPTQSYPPYPPSPYFGAGSLPHYAGAAVDPASLKQQEVTSASASMEGYQQQPQQHMRHPQQAYTTAETYAYHDYGMGATPVYGTVGNQNYQQGASHQSQSSSSQQNKHVSNSTASNSHPYASSSSSNAGGPAPGLHAPAGNSQQQQQQQQQVNYMNHSGYTNPGAMYHNAQYFNPNQMYFPYHNTQSFANHPQYAVPQQQGHQHQQHASMDAGKSKRTDGLGAFGSSATSAASPYDTDASRMTSGSSSYAVHSHQGYNNLYVYPQYDQSYGQLAPAGPGMSKQSNGSYGSHEPSSYMFREH
jgi:trimeric autotransporter adhesin